MRDSQRAGRRGYTLVNVVVVAAILFLAAYFALPLISSRPVSGRRNNCRSNLSNLAKAMIQYDLRQGHFPGYMNVLERTDKSAYIDRDTGTVVPVSWAVELLADLDRAQLYEEWRKVPGPTPDNPYIGNFKVFLEILICPSDDPLDRSRPALSYVVNTGTPDLPASQPQSSAAELQPAGTASQSGLPRDWRANGIFFDNYSDDPRINTNVMTRGPMIVMSSQKIVDPKDKTLLVTENLDASSYVFDPAGPTGPDPARTEIEWGCIWSPGSIRNDNGKFVMTPGDEASAPNAHRDPARERTRRESSYKYCRPSSSHPGGFNVAFAGGNVIFVSDKIDYLIYAKLMASDDANAMLPGSHERLDERFSGRLLRDEDLNP